MTVTDLVRNFQAALMGLIPSIGRVGIPWKRPDAYDEWDNITAAIYQALIVEPLRFSLPLDERDRFTLPAYDLLLPSYTGMSVIAVLPAQSNESTKVFHALGTVKTPFDAVEWRTVAPTGLPESNVLYSIPFEGARFELLLHTNGFFTRRAEV